MRVSHATGVSSEKLPTLRKTGDPAAAQPPCVEVDPGVGCRHQGDDNQGNQPRDHT